jgi:hypothetical protein
MPVRPALACCVEPEFKRSVTTEWALPVRPNTSSHPSACEQAVQAALKAQTEPAEKEAAGRICGYDPASRSRGAECCVLIATDAIRLQCLYLSACAVVPNASLSMTAWTSTDSPVGDPSAQQADGSAGRCGDLVGWGRCIAHYS